MPMAPVPNARKGDEVAAGRLRGERLLLRPVTLTDVTERYVDWLNDERVNRFLETRHSRQTLDGVRAYVDRITRRDDEWLFAICLEADGTHIGNIKLGPVKPHHGVADISLFIGEPACWGRGYATEAIRLLSGHALRDLGLHKISAGMYASNDASLRAFLKAGYREEGRRRKHYLLDGRPEDVIELGLCAEDLA